MDDFKSVKELERFEFRWKIIFAVSIIVFLSAALNYIVRTPRDSEAIICGAIGVMSFFGMVFAFRRLGDHLHQDARHVEPSILSDDDFSAGSSDE